MQGDNDLMRRVIGCAIARPAQAVRFRSVPYGEPLRASVPCGKYSKQ
jgi:hypothetical protein